MSGPLQEQPVLSTTYPASSRYEILYNEGTSKLTIFGSLAY